MRQRHVGVVEPERAQRVVTVGKDVAVREHHALRRAGGARGIDNRREIFAAALGDRRRRFGAGGCDRAQVWSAVRCGLRLGAAMHRDYVGDHGHRALEAEDLFDARSLRVRWLCRAARRRRRVRARLDRRRSIRGSFRKVSRRDRRALHRGSRGRRGVFRRPPKFPSTSGRSILCRACPSGRRARRTSARSFQNSRVMSMPRDQAYAAKTSARILSGCSPNGCRRQSRMEG